MEKRSVRFANSAAPNLLVFEVPDLNSVTGEKVVTYALPLIARQGGLLVALPVGVIDEDAFPHSPADEDQMVGPMKVLENIELYEEDETGTGAIQAVACGISCSVVIVIFWTQFCNTCVSTTRSQTRCLRPSHMMRPTSCIAMGEE